MAYVGKFGLLLCLVLWLSSGLVFGGKQEDLIDDLLKGYSPWVLPSTEANKSVEVDLRFTIKGIQSVDEEANSFTLMTYLDMRFVDERLRWDSKEYGFYTIRLPFKKIWLPDVVAYNGLSSTQLHEDIKAVIDYNGNVFAVSPQLVTVSCNFDLTYYPYDKQTCVIKYSSWTYDASEVNFKLGLDEPNLYEFVKNHEWDLVNATHILDSVTYPCCPQTPYRYAVITLELQRRSGPYTVKIVVPSVLTALLVLFTFILPSSSGEKIVFCVVLLLSLIHLSVYLHITLPTNSESVLGEFLTFALFLDFFATIITVICYNIADALLTPDKVGGPESQKHWYARKRKLKILRIAEFVLFCLFLTMFINGTNFMPKR
ncbi:neuronal acetylcholine receptor subunit alpha-6-like isoform X2 [Amphiura filiformis]|uniref:neuronal acetylcholine receptor subunit alpha-6-like isoform X2 n=1 Tax=Amphiura filiformis TaxID=82378 RepID=UPI003B2199F5